MSKLNRRAFVGATGGVAALLSQASLAVASDVPAPPQVPLGRTGIQLSRVAQGTGVHGGNRQSDQTRLGFEKLVSLFKHAYDRGITFFDLADLYGTHLYFREALRTIPREKVTILTKMWWRYDGPEANSREPERRQIARSTLERFRHELNTDYIDIVLLHCMTKSSWTEELQPYMEELAFAKENKQVRAIGVSCHDLGALEAAAKSPWVDVVLTRINPRGVKMDGTPEQITDVIREMKANGKAVIGMKIFGEGQLRDEREACIKFAQELGLLDAMTIGFEKPEQIDDVLRLLEKYPART
ncbi:MAG: aldo/keto reductase [Pirellulaceae bacterium]|nr:aldo/keto reductase [Planctomycetales bacterium]MCA9266236.1 aldo/keto reductase [Planctomycetales bacterium]